MTNITRKNLVVGVIIGLMNVAITTIFWAGRPIGASTSYPYVASWIFDAQNTIYFSLIAKAGSWELWFLIGTFVGACFGGIVFKRTCFRLVPERWTELKGDSVRKRIIWALIGGFVLILGARLADGCTSGHILSGGMELAVSSIVFAVFVCFSSVTFARIFYRGKNC